jgi:hypothetical protein
MVLCKESIINAIQEREKQLKFNTSIMLINEIKDEIMDLKTIIEKPTFTNIKRIINYTQDNYIYNLANDILTKMKQITN